MPPNSDAPLAGLLAALAALVPILALWGFTVDDGLISARVAHQLAAGHGYRFNAGGPVVDAVTPLGWAQVLSVFAASGPLAAFEAARWLGALCWLAAAAFLGAELARVGRRAFRVGILVLTLTAPPAAWAVAGMETGVVTALAALALARGGWAPLAAGFCAAWRPELAPWALVLALGRAAFEPAADGASRPRRVAFAAVAALGPPIAVAALRVAWFGHAYPLSWVAKPSDFTHGAVYALDALVFSGVPLLLVAFRAYGAASARTRVTLAALGVHLAALCQAGGDWMPLYRLFVPIVPSLILAGGEIAEQCRSRWAERARLGAFVLVSAAVAILRGPNARAVWDDRRAVIDAARPLLAGAERVAALDVGWLGAATPAHIVDLAGVTDESIARLPGGHTTKRLPSGLLELRRIDAIVALVTAPARAIEELEFARGVEASLPTLAGFDRFHVAGSVPLGRTRQRYVILRR